jgi:hypothetical protein
MTLKSNFAPLWLLVFVFSLVFILSLSLVFFPFLKNKVDITVLIIYGLLGWGILFIVSIIKIFSGLKKDNDFTLLNNKDKRLDILEENLELEHLGQLVSNLAKQNNKKIQSLFVPPNNEK